MYSDEFNIYMGSWASREFYRHKPTKNLLKLSLFGYFEFPKCSLNREIRLMFTDVKCK